MPRTWLVIGLSLLAVTASADDGMHHHDDGRPIRLGSQALPFGPLKVLNELEAGFSQLSFTGRPSGKARVTVLSFFAGWCPGCVNEMPVLKKIDASYRDRGVQVVSVSVDHEPDASSRLRELIGREGLRHPIVIDADLAVLHSYEGRNQSLPYLFVIGPDGIVADVHEGFGPDTEPALREVIDRLLTSAP